jgi:hypothetical protein
VPGFYGFFLRTSALLFFAFVDIFHFKKQKSRKMQIDNDYSDEGQLDAYKGGLGGWGGGMGYDQTLTASGC